MKDFLKYTLATVTGIIIFTLVVGMICVISLVGMAASDSATVNVKENSVYVRFKVKGQEDTYLAAWTTRQTCRLQYVSRSK